jgi:prophage regulatory protein
MPSTATNLSGVTGLRLIDKAACSAKRGTGHSALYVDIRRGLWTKPVKIGKRGSRWPEHEADAIIAARVAGKSDADIRELVATLHAQRLVGVTVGLAPAA